MSKKTHEGLFLVISLPEIFLILTTSYFLKYSVHYTLWKGCVSFFPLAPITYNPKGGLAGVQNFEACMWWSNLILAPHDIFTLIFPLPHFTSFCFSSVLIHFFIVLLCLCYTTTGEETETYLISSTFYISSECHRPFLSSCIIIKYHYENEPGLSFSHKHTFFAREL